jgi:hypothetical protein
MDEPFVNRPWNNLPPWEQIRLEVDLEVINSLLPEDKQLSAEEWWNKEQDRLAGK